MKEVLILLGVIISMRIISLIMRELSPKRK